MNTSIVICGKKYDIGTRVILWDEPDGLNGYDISSYITTSQNRKTGKLEKSVVKGKRYSKRTWRENPTLGQLQEIVYQFFLHHSGLYRAKDTFHVLHNQRRLSVHFILDDKNLYQTLDLKEKAWHGGKNNPMSVGIEIDSRAHADRFPDAYDEAHCKKYGVEPRTKRIDHVQGIWTHGYEYTNKQYETLIRLGIGLADVFPNMNLRDFPRNNGRLIKKIISNPTKHHGYMCHYNSSSSKNDPIAFDHYRFIRGIHKKDPNYPSTFLKINDTEDIQTWLTNLNYDAGPIDGDYGPKTKMAVKKFQDDHNLIIDGVWGEKTEYTLDLETKARGKR